MVSFAALMRAFLRPTNIAALSLLLLSALFGGCKQDERPDASAELISAFAGSCSSRGFWSDAALSHTHKLVGVLQALKEKDHCKGLDETFRKIHSLETQLSFMLNNTAYRDYRVAEETIQEISLELKRPDVAANTELSATLTAALAEAKASLATKRVGKNVDQFHSATAQTAQALQALTSQTKDLSLCLSQSPAAAVQLATNALALGGSFITPVLGAGVGAVGALLNGAVDYVRHKGTNDGIWKLYGSSMPLALTCGLESMTQLYCQANDAFSLIDFQQKNYGTHGPSDLWTSLDILGRRMPVLNRWIQKVKTGVVPSNPDEAKRQIAVWSKIQFLDNASLDAEGNINATIELYEASKGKPDDQKDLVIKFVSGGANLAGSTTCSNNNCSASPLQLTTDWELYACYWVIGVEAGRKSCPKRDVMSNETQEQWLRNKVLTMVNLDDYMSGGGLRKNWEEILATARSRVDVEFSETITVDPTSLLDLAYQAQPDNLSPREILSMLEDFLTEAQGRPDDGKNPHHKPLIAATLATVKNLINALETPDEKKTAADRVSQLFAELELKKGARVFVERLTNLLTADIRERLKNEEFPKDISEILKAAGIDVHERLVAAGVSNLGTAATDINQSQSLVQSNIENFTAFFAPSFVKAVKELDKRAKKSGEPATGAHRPNGQTLAKLCLLLVSTDYEFKDKDARRVCSNARLTSIYADPKNPDEELDLEVGKVWAKLKTEPYYMNRVCAYHRFMRAERLAEIVRSTKLKQRDRQSKIYGILSDSSFDVPLGLAWAI